MAELLSLTGFLLAFAAILIGGEALRRISPRAGGSSDEESVAVLQKRIEVLERTLAELKNRERLAGYRFSPELDDSERFAPSHHVLKRHYLV